MDKSVIPYPSFFTFLRQALDFSLFIFLELHRFSQSSEKSLMALREFQLILLESLAQQLTILPIEAIQLFVVIQSRNLSHLIDLS